MKDVHKTDPYTCFKCDEHLGFSFWQKYKMHMLEVHYTTVKSKGEYMKESSKYYEKTPHVDC